MLVSTVHARTWENLSCASTAWTLRTARHLAMRTGSERVNHEALSGVGAERTRYHEPGELAVRVLAKISNADDTVDAVTF